MGNPARGRRQFMIGQEMRAAVERDGVQARIAQRDLETRSGRRVARDDTVYVIQKMLEHNVAYYDMLAARRNFLTR